MCERGSDEVSYICDRGSGGLEESGGLRKRGERPEG